MKKIISLLADNYLLLNNINKKNLENIILNYLPKSLESYKLNKNLSNDVLDILENIGDQINSLLLEQQEQSQSNMVIYKKLIKN